jgi:hypothetical protein
VSKLSLKTYRPSRVSVIAKQQMMNWKLIVASRSNLCFMFGVTQLLSSEQNPEECDATDDHSSNAVGSIILRQAKDDKHDSLVLLILLTYLTRLCE